MLSLLGRSGCFVVPSCVVLGEGCRKLTGRATIFVDRLAPSHLFSHRSYKFDSVLPEGMGLAGSREVREALAG